MQLFSERQSLISGILFLTITIVAAQESPAVKRWPTIYKPKTKAKIVTLQRGDETRPYIYHTRHFELRSPIALSRRHLEKFATVAESVPEVISRIPLPLLGMPPGGRAKVLIFPDEDSFIKAGGVQGAAGYYSGKKAAIMLRADTFLHPPTAGSRLPPKADYDLLVHEFVHLCMHRNLGYLPTWFSEGVAEYFAAAHTDFGVYRFDHILQSIRNRVKQALAHENNLLTLPGVVETMPLTPKTWQNRIVHGKAVDSYRMYGSSLLIVHALFHGGTERRNATRTFLQNINARKPAANQVELLIPTKERNQLQKRITTYWRPRGLRLKFSTASD